MNEWIDENRWKAAAAAVVLLALYLFVNVLVPVMQQSRETFYHVQQQEQKIEMAANWKEKQKEYNRQEQKLSKLYSRLFVHIPENDQMSAIINLLIEEARKAEVAIRRVEPLDHIEKKAYTLVPIELNVEGGFHRILRFMNGLEQANYLVRLTRLSMEAPGEYGNGVLSVRLRLNVTVIQNEPGPGGAS